jgi:hypothetical protein
VPVGRYTTDGPADAEGSDAMEYVLGDGDIELRDSVS